MLSSSEIKDNAAHMLPLSAIMNRLSVDSKLHKVLAHRAELNNLAFIFSLQRPLMSQWLMLFAEYHRHTKLSHLLDLLSFCLTLSRSLSLPRSLSHTHTGSCSLALSHACCRVRCRTRSSPWQMSRRLRKTPRTIRPVTRRRRSIASPFAKQWRSCDVGFACSTVQLHASRTGIYIYIYI